MSKKLIGSVIVALVVIGSGIGLYVSSGNGHETYEVKSMDLENKSTLVGTVKANKDLDLGFEVSGKVANVLVTENQEINAGDVLIELQRNDLYAQRTQAFANLEEARSSLNQQRQQVDLELAKLDDLLEGSTREEVVIAERLVELREQELEKAKDILEESETSDDNEIQNILDESKVVLNSSMNQALSSLYTLTDLQFTIYPSIDNDGILVGFHKAQAAEKLVGLRDASRSRKNTISEARGGLVEELSSAELLNLDEVTEFSFELTSVFQDLNNALTYFVLDDEVSQASLDMIASQKTVVSSELSNLSNFRSKINTTERTNQENIRNLENNILVAEKALDQAESELNKVVAGPTQNEINIQEIAVEQAKSLVDSREARVMFENGRLAAINADIAKRVLTSPINGNVVNLDISVGEIAGLSEEVVTIQASNDLLVEIDLPERYLNKVQESSNVIVKLDAFEEKEFEGEVARINKESTLVDNVPIFKVDLRISADGYEVRSGMTGDVEIVLEKAENVLALPKRLIYTDNDGEYVQLVVDEATNQTEKRYVETGIQSSKAMVEIKEGLEEGDIVLELENN